MKLVDRNTHEKVKTLSEDDKRALVDYYLKATSTRLAVATDIIASARLNSQYFVCDCVPDQPSSPTLTSRMVGNDNLVLVNLPGRHSHAFDCPFSYASSETTGRSTTPNHEIDNLVFVDDGRIQVNGDQLKILYRTLTTNTQLNRLTPDITTSPETFRDRMLAGSRLSPTFAKQGVSKKIRFGIDSYSGMLKELKDNDKDDWIILISRIDGVDGFNLFKGDISANPYKIPAGQIVSLPTVTYGPMVATTIVASKGNYAFSLATAIDSVFSPELPVVVSSQEDRDIINELTGKRSLLSWVDRKQPNPGDESSFVDIHCLPTLAPITKTKTTPRMTIGKQGLRLLVADPVKTTREAYDEQGIVLWHRNFSHIHSKALEEFKQFKSKVAAILLKSG